MPGLSGATLLTSTAFQTLFLFVVDGLSNVVDYLFHVFIGRALTPGDFAIVQTINAVFLIVGTAFAVFQPVVARYVAEASDQADAAEQQRAVFQLYIIRSSLIGFVLAGSLWLGRDVVASWLKVPVAAVTLAALTVVFLFVRPVVSGMLQGQERFVAFGITRSSYAISRLLFVLVLVGALGGNAVVAVATMPLAGTVALAAGILLLGAGVWKRRSATAAMSAREWLGAGWQLSLAAFLAYVGYMALLNLDVIFANRMFSAAVSGSYASAAVLRRILSLLPGAVLVVLYPRVAAQVARSQLPDRLLAKSLALIVSTTTLLTLVFFLWGDWFVPMIFGAEYGLAGSLLGWMGIGMIGFGITAVWMNLFLATRPWLYSFTLVAIVLLQAIFYSYLGSSPLQMTFIFLSSGWIAALIGGLLYGFWLRPQLQRATATTTTPTAPTAQR